MVRGESNICGVGVYDQEHVNRVSSFSLEGGRRWITFFSHKIYICVKKNNWQIWNVWFFRGQFMNSLFWFFNEILGPHLHTEILYTLVRTIFLCYVIWHESMAYCNFYYKMEWEKLKFMDGDIKEWIDNGSICYVGI